MDIGLTVGDDLDRLAASPKRFDFCELGVGEPTLVPGDIDPERLDDALAGRDLLVHLPYSQRLASYVPEVNDAIVDYQRRLLEAAGELGAEKAVLHATSADRDDTEFREVAAEQLRRVADAGRDAGVEVVVENVGHQHAGLQLSVLGDIARETDTRICFDLGHAYMEGDNKAIKRFLRSHGAGSHTSTVTTPAAGVTPTFPWEPAARSTTATWSPNSAISTGRSPLRCSPTTRRSSSTRPDGSRSGSASTFK